MIDLIYSHVKKKHIKMYKYIFIYAVWLLTSVLQLWISLGLTVSANTRLQRHGILFIIFYFMCFKSYVKAFDTRIVFFVIGKTRSCYCYVVCIHMFHIADFCLNFSPLRISYYLKTWILQFSKNKEYSSSSRFLVPVSKIYLHVVIFMSDVQFNLKMLLRKRFSMDAPREAFAQEMVVGSTYGANKRILLSYSISQCVVLALLQCSDQQLFLEEDSMHRISGR